MAMPDEMQVFVPPFRNGAGLQRARDIAVHEYRAGNWTVSENDTLD